MINKNPDLKKLLLTIIIIVGLGYGLSLVSPNIKKQPLTIGDPVQDQIKQEKADQAQAEIQAQNPIQTEKSTSTATSTDIETLEQ